MRRLGKHSVVLTTYLVVYFSLVLSATLSWAASPIARLACDKCEEADRFVRLQVVSENIRSASPRQFTHPFVLSPEDWTSILRELKVQRQAEGLLFRDPRGPVVPIFMPEDISYFSAALSQAFAQAQPHEMVVFGLSRLNAYNMNEITTGGWFVDGPSLHVVLANYRKVVTMPSTRQLLWERPLRPDAGPHYDLVAGTHQTSVRDLSAWSGLFSSAPSELSISYQGALLGELGESSAPQKSPAQASDIVPSTLSIEERLRALKRLHDQGLISDDDYRDKKQQLLDRL